MAYQIHETNSKLLIQVVQYFQHICQVYCSGSIVLHWKYYRYDLVHICSISIEEQHTYDLDSISIARTRMKTILDCCFKER
jgi:hypothetical protein